MALKELKKEMRHCAVSPLIFLWREYLSYKVFPERKLGQQPCDEVAQCEGTEGQRQDEQGVPSSMAFSMSKKTE